MILLDINIFDGVKPRNWGTILKKYIEENYAENYFEMFNKNGESETVIIQPKNRRVNNHRVIDKLIRVGNDNIKILTIAHIPKALKVTTKYDDTKENTHSWLDENGWDIRKVYVMDREWNIYSSLFNIAKGNELTLYVISNIKNRCRRSVLSSKELRLSQCIYREY